jgi:hypothetical protein
VRWDYLELSLRRSNSEEVGAQRVAHDARDCDPFAFEESEIRFERGTRDRTAIDGLSPSGELFLRSAREAIRRETVTVWLRASHDGTLRPCETIRIRVGAGRRRVLESGSFFSVALLADWRGSLESVGGAELDFLGSWAFCAFALHR